MISMDKKYQTRDGRDVIDEVECELVSGTKVSASNVNDGVLVAIEEYDDAGIEIFLSPTKTRQLIRMLDEAINISPKPKNQE